MLKYYEIILNKLMELIRERQFSQIKAVLQQLRPPDIAELIGRVDRADRALVFRLLSKDTAIKVFEELSADDQLLLLETFSDDDVTAIVDELAPDDRAELFEEMPAKVTARLMRLTSAEKRDITATLLGFAEDTAGRVMTTEYIRLREEMNTAEALEHIRSVGLDRETIYYCFITDTQRRLTGVVSLRDLVLSGADVRLAEIMDRDVIAVHTDQDQEEVAEILSRYDLLAVPVVDSENRLVGIVTVDDVADIIREEATEDFQKMAPVALMKTGLRDAGLWTLYRVRAPWLLALVFMNVFSGAAIAHFEATIEAVVALVFFLPLLIDSAGNAGSQTATLIVRSMAVGDVKPKDWLHMVVKDLSVVVFIGLTMALGVSAIAAFRAPEVLFPVALTMVCTVVYGSMLGVCLPFVLTKLRFDPAAASAPLITSLADIGGVIIYFTIASWYLGV